MHFYKRAVKIWSLVCAFGLISCDSGTYTSTNTTKNGAKTPSQVVKPQRELMRVEGSQVNFRITTFIGISCKEYDKQFSSTKALKITEKAKLAAIDSRLKILEPDTHKYEIDTRAKIIFFYSNLTTDTLCISRFNSYYKGRLVSNDVKLNQLLGITID